MVVGSMALGHFLYPIIIGGLKVLTPMEAAMFADAAAGVAIGAWLLLAKKRPS